MAQKSTVSTDPTLIKQFLTRAVENVYPTPAKLGELLASGKRITAYQGIDPTGPSIHLGHAIGARKLAVLQKLGHRVILLIGDFTAMIGDPTDKMAVRKQLTREDVLANCKNYKKQLSNILDFGGSNPVELKFNSEWLAKMSFQDVVELAAHFTVQQMVERDMFHRRIEEGKPVHLHEFLYPLMQGYDSVAMDVDLEIGGNDQTFNMLAGRTLMREIKNKEKSVLTTKLLVDATGKKMGKTEGNMITLADAPEDMFGKVMSWTDGMILPGFELCTDVSEDEIADIGKGIKKGENPVEFKRRLAKEIVSGFISAKAADEAEAHFSTIHQKGEVPDDVPEVKISGKMPLIDALIASELVSSKSDARRQIEQGGVKVDGEIVKDFTAEVAPGALIQKGKRHFVKLVKG
ncbi:MAG: tyrosine--tRNA ligase [Patescibacteria group bacterium]